VHSLELTRERVCVCAQSSRVARNQGIERERESWRERIREREKEKKRERAQERESWREHAPTDVHLALEVAKGHFVLLQRDGEAVRVSAAGMCERDHSLADVIPSLLAQEQMQMHRGQIIQIGHVRDKRWHRRLAPRHCSSLGVGVDVIEWMWAW
jgi:hypothetical protein